MILLYQIWLIGHIWNYVVLSSSSNTSLLISIINIQNRQSQWIILRESWGKAWLFHRECNGKEEEAF